MVTRRPSNSPTLAPTMSPAFDPTAGPIAGPTLDPTLDPTAGPTLDPTLDPTTGPTFLPTLVPTRSSTAVYTHLRRVSSIAPTFPIVTYLPTFLPSRYVVNAKTTNRVSKIYKAHAFFLKNTDAGVAVRNFLLIENHSQADLDALRISLNTYKNGLGAN